MKIGLLIPRSSIYNTIGFDMVDGLKASLQYHGLEGATVVTDNIGFGGDLKEVTAAAERLLMQHDVDVMVSPVNRFFTESLNNLMQGASRVLIGLDTGYELPTELKTESNLFRVSLNSYVAARQAVKEAARRGVRRYLVSISYYDAGYRMPVAFETLTSELGGEVGGTYVTALKTADFSLDPLVRGLKENMPDALFASFCREMALQFFDAASREGVFATPMIIGAPFMLEETYLKEVSWPGWKLHGCVSWSQSLPIPENRKVQDYFTSVKPREMNLFSLLAWEAGQVIAQGIAGDFNAAKAIPKLREFSYDGPRGKVTMDARNQTTVSPLWNVETVASEDGKTNVRVLGECMDWNDEYEKWYADVNAGKGAGTSWQNLYPCI